MSRPRSRARSHSNFSDGELRMTEATDKLFRLLQIYIDHSKKTDFGWTFDQVWNMTFSARKILDRMIDRFHTNRRSTMRGNSRFTEIEQNSDGFKVTMRNVEQGGGLTLRAVVITGDNETVTEVKFHANLQIKNQG